LDAGRFDAAVRSFAATLTRRGVIVGGVAAALGALAGERAVSGKGKKTCKPKCSACATCTKGKCKSTCGEGFSCLANGGCALKCETTEDCPNHPVRCSCVTTAKGGRHCRVPIDDAQCVALPTCKKTSDCPLGQICQKCPGDPRKTFLCAPTCG
jgi:hypothetical protein